MKLAPVSDSAPLDAVRLFRTFGKLVAVADFTNTFYSGELLSLLGPNGAGKTTLIRMLTGILKPDSGTVSLRGTKRPARCQIAYCIGYCPQRIIIWRDLTCLEQLVLVCNMYGISGREATRRADELLEMFHLSSRRHTLAGTMSGGMQRRLSISLAMVHRPAVLVLDEPQAGLDPQSRVLIRSILKQLVSREGTSVILSTHDMAEAELLSDRVVILNSGRVIGDGAPADLIAQAGAGQILEVHPEDNTDEGLDQFVELLAKLGLTTTRKDRVILVDSDSSDALVRPIRRVAADANIVISELRYRKRSLEDVFLALTSSGGLDNGN